MALLACPPGERHELGLLSFGLALRERGWRIIYLGADTPVAEVGSAVDLLSPAIVVLAAVVPERFADRATEISALAARTRTAIAGAWGLGGAGGRARGRGARRRLHRGLRGSTPVGASPNQSITATSRDAVREVRAHNPKVAWGEPQGVVTECTRSP